MALRKPIAITGLLLFSLHGAAPVAHAMGSHQQALLQLLSTKQCPGCLLSGADLVHADLQGANLRGAQLQGANLSQANLAGANLDGANLSHTTLWGANLQGSSLWGAVFLGTDLRQADLMGAAIEANGLQSSHLEGARNIPTTARSVAQIHNAGVAAYEKERYREAEQLFSEAISTSPASAESWAARGLTRSQQGNHELALADLNYSVLLFESRGEPEKAQQCRQISQTIQSLATTANGGRSGNGAGIAVLEGAVQLFRLAAPLAIRALSGVPF